MRQRAERAATASSGPPGNGNPAPEQHDLQRLDVPFAWKHAGPKLYAWALAATGLAHEAMQNAGEAEFQRAAVEQAQGQPRDGLPLRAEINIVGYLARKPGRTEHA